MFQCRFLATVMIFVGSAGLAFAEDAVPRSLSGPEQELVAIVNDMYAMYDKFYDGVEKLPTDEEKQKQYAEHDPALTFVPKLIEFEKSHRGTHAGLMAVRQMFLLGDGGGEHGNPRYEGRRHALTLINDYVKAPELPEILRYLDTGNIQPTDESVMRQLISSPDASEQLKASSKLILARWPLTLRDGRDYCEKRLKELERGSPLQYPAEQKYLTQTLEASLPRAQLNEMEKESIAILNELTSMNFDLRQTGVKGIDGNNYIIDFDPEKTKTMPLISEQAAGVLFKEQHLRIGRPAPDLKVQLITGDEWSLADQRGKTVVIQFSFKGCGPCEAMYPDLSSLQTKYDNKLSILGLMVDENREITVEAVKSGKLTWNIHWDGECGPIATKWAVRGFPAVYVIGPDGRIAGTALRGEELKKKIAELTR